jgi:hypothetical protein
MPRKTQPAHGQLSLFDNTADARPLPIIVADKWGFSLQYHIVDDVYYYAGQDWIAGMTGRPDAARKTYVYQVGLIGDELSSSTRQLNYKAANSKTYQMDYLTDKGLYRLTQSMRDTKKHPLVNVIKQYLSDAGAFADLARREPETVGRAVLSYSDKRKRQELATQGWSEDEIQQWLDVRSVQRVSAGRIAAAWERGGIVEKQDYAKLHNAVSEVATGNTATQHKIALHTGKPREGLSAYENAAIHVVQTVAELFHTTRQSHGLSELTTDIHDSDAIINRDELARQMNKTRPRLTGK